MFSHNENIIDYIIIKTIQATPSQPNEYFRLLLPFIIMFISLGIKFHSFRKSKHFLTIHSISTTILNVIFIVSNISSFNIPFKMHIYTCTSFILISKHLAHLSTCSRLILTEILTSKLCQFDITESTIPSQFAFNIITIHLLIYNTFKLMYSSKLTTNIIIKYHLLLTLLCIIIINITQFVYLFSSEHFYTFIWQTLSFSHLCIILYWCLTLALFAFIYAKYIVKSNTLLIIKRKYYHFLIFILLFPAIYFSNIEILRTLTLIVLYFMIVVEVLRNDKRLKHNDIMKNVTAFIKSNVDEKDTGKIVLTHIFLLSGVCSSLFCNCGEKKSCYYIGSITLAIGDSLCSIIGVLFGKIRIYGNKRTLEGTVGGLGGALLVLMGVKWMYGEIGMCKWDVVKFGVVFLYEGITMEIDNLVLPIVANCLFG